jgi:hypothetical protein
MAAIDAANLIQNLVDQGIDPITKFTSQPSKPAVSNPNQFKERVSQFLKLYALDVKPATFDQANRLLQSKYVSDLNGIDVSRITRAMIVRLL